MSKETRKLAVALFADIAGYTAMMQKDEAAAVTCLNRFKEALDIEVPEKGGEIVQFYGDGVLVLFTSSVGALQCAMALQKRFKEAPAIPVRIGLNDGEVILKADNAFGDSINIASRIESIAIPGAVLFSGSIFDQVHNKSQFECEFIGKFHFKNVNKEIDVYGLTNDGLPVPKKGEVAGKLAEKKTRGWKIAVPLLLIIAVLSILTIRFAKPGTKAEKIENLWEGNWHQQVESSTGSYIPGLVQWVDSLGVLTGRSIHEYEEVDMELTNVLFNIVQSEDQRSISGRWRSEQLEQHGQFSLRMTKDGKGFEGTYTFYPDTTPRKWIGTRE